MFALKSLMAALGSANIDARYAGSPLHPKYGRASYLFNSTIAGIDEADAIMLIGTNPRREAAVLNARIRKRYLKGNVLIGSIGEKADLTYPYNYLGAGPDSLAQFVDHRAGARRKADVHHRAGRAQPRRMARRCSRWRRKLRPRSASSRMAGTASTSCTAKRRCAGALDIGFVPGEGGAGHRAACSRPARSMCCSCSGSTKSKSPSGAFVVYIGTHGDRGAHRADVILPGAAYPEKSATYVNTEGRVQMTNRAAFPPGDAREDWAILRALSDALGHKLPYDSLGALRQALFAAHPHLMRIGEIAAGDADDIGKLAKLGGTCRQGAVALIAVSDFYFTNAITRASAIMAECSALAHAAARTAAE